MFTEDVQEDNVALSGEIGCSNQAEHLLQLLFLLAASAAMIIRCGSKYRVLFY